MKPKSLCISHVVSYFYETEFEIWAGFRLNGWVIYSGVTGAARTLGRGNSTITLMRAADATAFAEAYDWRKKENMSKPLPRRRWCAGSMRLAESIIVTTFSVSS